LLYLPREVLQERGEAARIAARNYSWTDCAKAHALALKEAQRKYRVRS